MGSEFWVRVVRPSESCGLRFLEVLLFWVVVECFVSLSCLV